MAEQTLNLYQKLVEVQKSVDYLQKDANGYQFKYNKNSQVVYAIRSKMDELGLLLVPSVKGHTMQLEGKNIITEVDLEFTWINADNPEERLTPSWYAQGTDTSERGVGKAYTYAEKFFILKFFHVATDEEDPDAFQRKHDDTPKPTPQQRPTPTQTNGKATPAQKKALGEAVKKAAFDGNTYIQFLDDTIGHHPSKDDLTTQEAAKLLESIAGYKEAIA